MTGFDASTDAQVREILKAEGVFEAHRLVAEYRCHRNRKDGEHHEILVRIYDMGPGNPAARYSWDVSVPDSEEPEPISANPAESIVMAGYKPHWNLLDGEARRAR